MALDQPNRLTTRMILKEQQNPLRISRKFPRALLCVSALAWTFAALALINTLWFALRDSSPVIQQDAWYFLDVFLRKAIDGTLTLPDFLVKRVYADHAQPLAKIVLWLEWRYFHLDFVVEAVVGVLSAGIVASIMYRLVMVGRRGDNTDIKRYLAWAAMCALLLSLNTAGRTWTWPLVALGNLSFIPILLFVLVVWWACKRQRYVLLGVATLLFGFVSDDNALITVIAVGLALLLAAWRAPDQSRATIAKALVLIMACLALVRIGYQFTPVEGGSPSQSMLSYLPMLVDRFKEGGWWKWWALPLILPVAHDKLFAALPDSLWKTLQVFTALSLLMAQVAFWRRAFLGRFNSAVFVAVCLTLISYGWLAGILLMRVSTMGNDYLYQERYVQLFQFLLIAMMLMWSTSERLPSNNFLRRTVTTGLPMLGCLLLIAIQLPLSFAAWHMRPYDGAYYGRVALRIVQLNKDPASAHDCMPETPICGWPLRKRAEVLGLLSDNKLNVFSPSVRQAYPYLESLPVSPRKPASQKDAGQ